MLSIIEGVFVFLIIYMKFQFFKNNFIHNTYYEEQVLQDKMIYKKFIN